LSLTKDCKEELETYREVIEELKEDTIGYILDIKEISFRSSNVE
jgi:hypothetical protein